MRIQKYLSQSGYCSRRKAEEMIKSERITINDSICEIGEDVDPDVDVIRADNKIIKNTTTKVYIAINKPVGYICSTNSKQGKTILDLVNKDEQKKYGLLYPVGRLDKDSQGLVLVTNDGELANELMHPSSEHEKEYDVTIDKRLSDASYKTLKKGMTIDHKVKVKGIEIKKIRRNEENYVVSIVLKEGKNRQVRKMFGNLGYVVKKLLRTRVAKLKLGTIKKGEYAFVEKKHII